MALENSRSKKRQRRSIKRKLDVKQSVEVRSMEQGFLGSWHPGEVMKCGPLMRFVKYENLLDDDGVNRIMEEVRVPRALDDNDSNSSDRCIRGSIRPTPPFIEFEESELEFGLCVDVDHQDAWWEGVIFDRCDGRRERSVFFPDLGDEMKIEVCKMRITHDWDEVTGKWRRRGKWVFLELMDEYESKSYLPVSIKQVWYDVRTNKDFETIKEWTHNVKDLWSELVMRIVDEYFALTLEEISSVLDLPNSLLKEIQELELAGQPNAIVNFNQGISSQHSTSKTLLQSTDETSLKVTHENVGTRVPKLPVRQPPVRPPYPSPIAARPTPFRPTISVTPFLQPIVLLSPHTAPTLTPSVVQPPSPSARSSPPPNEANASETIETGSATSSMFLRSMRFMPTPGLKAPKND